MAKVEEAVEKFQKDSEQKLVLGQSIEGLQKRVTELKQQVNLFTQETQVKEKELGYVLAEIKAQNSVLGSIEQQTKNKQKEVLDEIAKKEKKLDGFIKDYEQAVKDQKELVKKAKADSEALVSERREIQERSDRLTHWVQTAEKSITERESAYSDSQKGAEAQIKAYNKAKSEAEKAEKESDKKLEEIAKAESTFDAKKDSYQKQLDALVATKEKNEADYKAKMQEVVALKASIEGEKADLEKKKEMVEEMRLNAQALENRTLALVKRYNLDKEAKQ